MFICIAAYLVLVVIFTFASEWILELLTGWPSVQAVETLLGVREHTALLLLLLVSLVVPYPGSRALYVALRWKQVPDDIPHCKRCGYNLTGNTSGVCPECGKTIPARSTVSSQPRSFSRSGSSRDSWSSSSSRIQMLRKRTGLP